ncbi:MAG: hypothetical protein AMK72_02035 [Planctomycetes bacterium SM23_25]|nr:MAG: hypothetical protein AMK72_02035 [Planctomycetes bacterium SM23_25]
MSTAARVSVLLVVVGLIAIALVAFHALTKPQQTATAISIGGKHFTEQEILGEIMALMIEANTDLTVHRKLNLGGTMICFNALRAGDLDLYAEYTGTGLVNILKRDVIADSDKAYQAVSEAFKAEYDLVWLEPFGFNNTYTLTMRAKHAEQLGVRSISELATKVRAGEKLRAAFDAEFLVRPDGYSGLRKTYDFRFPEEPRQMDPGLMYKSAADGDVDVIDGFATDGRIPAFDLMVLEDDKCFFPPYHAAPLVRADALARCPQLKHVLNRLAGKIDGQSMQRLNYEVDEEGRQARDVAREFLKSQGLIP